MTTTPTGPRPTWTPPAPNPTALRRAFCGPDGKLWAALALGVTLIALWFVQTHTTLFTAYRAGSLSQVQAICDSSIGRFSQALSATGAAQCHAIDSQAMWYNLGGFAGLLAAGVSGLMLLIRTQRRH